MHSYFYFYLIYFLCFVFLICFLFGFYGCYDSMFIFLLVPVFVLLLSVARVEGFPLFLQ